MRFEEAAPTFVPTLFSSLLASLAIVSSANDSSLPVMLCPPSSFTAPSASAYASLADVLVKKLFERDVGLSLAFTSLPPDSSQDPIVIDGKHIDANSLSLKLDKTRGLLMLRIFSEDGAAEKEIDPTALLDSNPKTGETMGGSR